MWDGQRRLSRGQQQQAPAMRASKRLKRDTLLGARFVHGAGLRVRLKDLPGQKCREDKP